ncbi:MAG TPA: TonB-dependent receptor [Candidatus Acidoferrum sp.]|nr:TonB-dependent receptor [Candidatus Acidoferrum sp.]
MARRFSLLTLLGIVILAAWGKPSYSQVGASGAQLNGTVRDASGGTVARANITLRELNTNRTASAVTNENGFYAVPNLTPGRYELTVEASGFAKVTQTGIVLTVGQTATLDVTLKVASGTEKVVVTTETPVIEPTKTEISQVVETQQIDSLPISGRLFTDFALLTPGVATSRTSLGTTFTDFETSQISFGGMRSFSNEVTVDGADFVSMLTGVQRSTPPQESVQEFRVVNNSFGAEYGRAAGGIVNIVTKPGTNDLHGSVYEYLQNNATDARYMLQPAPLPHELRQNQFGGTLGGPIQKDKTFFFANYEGKRRAESPVYPPDLINNLQLIDDAKALMGLAPEGCATGLSQCNGTDISYLDGFLKTTNDDWGFVRLDHQINLNNHLGVRYNVEDTRLTGALVGQTLDGGGIGVPSGGRDLFIRDQSIFGTLDSSLKSNLVNTVLVQWARRHYNFPGMTGQPDFSITNDLELGHNFGTDDRKYESRIQFSDSISWVKGKHVWKFGFDGNYLKDLDNFPGFTPVRAIVPSSPGLGCFAAFAAFYNSKLPTPAPVPADVAAAAAPAGGCPVLGDNGVVFTYAGTPLPTDPTFTSGKPLVTATNNPLNTSTWANAYQPSLFNNYSHVINHGYWAGFAQDQWRITHKLALNYGLRWEFESGLSQYVAPDYGGWQPRVGLAYSPDSKTVIRAGFGMFDDRYNLTFFFVPNTQKVAPGYLCGNHPTAAIAAACTAAGILAQNLPNLESNLGQANQGYQLFGFPASQGAAAIAAEIIATGGYDAVENKAGVISMSGTCFLNGACGVGEGGMEHNSKIPYSEQASFEIDRQLGGGFALNLGYQFVGAHRLVRGGNINIPCPVGTTKSGPPTDPLALPVPTAPGEWVPGLVNADGTLSACTGAPTLGTGALAGLGPFFGGALNSGLQTISAGLMDYNNDVAKAAYHGLTVSGRERIGGHFNLTANYTYSHTLDNGNFTTFINLPVNQFDYSDERANSNQDVRHHFVTNFIATAPEKSFLRYFSFSSIITVQSGRPFTIFYGNNTLQDVAGVATDRVGGAPFSSGCPSVTNCQTMIPRNTYIGDPLRTWDLRVGRTIHLREGKKLDLTMDAFNVLNRANVDEVTSVYGSPVFCGNAIPRHYKDATTLAIEQGVGSTACPVATGAGAIVIPGIGSLAPTPITSSLPTCGFAPTCPAVSLFIPALPNGTFGLPRTMLNPRQLQFAAKFTF